MEGDKDQVKDVVVPVMTRAVAEPRRLQPRGTGFFLGSEGYLVTCEHVVRGLRDDEELIVHQDGKGRSLKIDVVATDTRADLALCFSERPPDTTAAPALIDVYPSHDVFALGYPHELRGPDKPPVVQRVLKGHVVAIADPAEYADTYELSFPSPLGMSGAPLWCFYQHEDSGERRKGITGILFGSRESSIEVFKHEERNELGIVERERILRVTELGLARQASRIVTFLQSVESGPAELQFTYLPGS